MTTNSWQWTLLVCELWTATQVAWARAEPPATELRVEIAGPETLGRGSHISIPIFVTVPRASQDMPLALTPHIEGEAVELVRGRLLRADGKLDENGRLRFELPVVGHSDGTAILRVEVMTYACEPRCVRVDASQTRALRVR
jgi:hypothetical protein